MHILHVYKDYWPPVLGGIEKHLHTLATLQAQAGHQVTVLVTNPAPFPASLRTRVTEERPGLRVVRAGRLVTVASTPLSPWQALWQARIHADVVHFHFPYPPGEVAHYLWGRARAAVMTYHSDVIRQRRILRLYRPLLHRVLARMDAIIATSRAYVSSSPFLRAHRDRVHVIPLGIDLKPFAQVDRAAAHALRREATAAHPEWPVVLFVGRLRYYKGVDVLLRALTQVPQAWLWVVGRGPMETPWRQLAHTLGLAPRVRFWGDVPEATLYLLYAAADIFVLPATSRAEALGLVQIEAMASGLPVISTELHTGTSEVNVHGRTGLVVPPGDVAALAQALQTLVAQPILRRRLGEAARARAREYDATRMAQQVLALYERLLHASAS